MFKKMVHFDRNVDIKHYDLSLEEVIIKKEAYHNVLFDLEISNILHDIDYNILCNLCISCVYICDMFLYYWKYFMSIKIT